MSSILPSSTAPAPPVNAGRRTATRTDESDLGTAGSFGEVLARSGQPATDKPADKPAVKTAAPARHPADPEKTDKQDPVNPLAALLIPLENRTTAAALPEGSGLSNAHAGAEGAAMRAGVLQVADMARPAADALPGGSDFSDAQAHAGVPTDAAVAKALAETLPIAGASEIIAGPAGLAALALPPAAGAYRVGQTPAQARQAALGDGTVTAAASRSMADPTGTIRADLPELAPTSAGDDAAAGTAGNQDAGLALLAANAPTGDSGSAQGLLQPAGPALQASAGASAPNLPAPASAATALLTPQVGSSEWSKALGQQVVHMGTAGNPVAELQLNPPGLGPLKVTLSMVDQQMQAVFVSAHSSVRAAVEAALPQLRALLAESGISLGNTSVGAESQPQTAFSNGQNNPNSRLPREVYRSAEADAAALFSARQTAQPAGTGSSLRIDTYA